jgi:hypothetical protein
MNKKRMNMEKDNFFNEMKRNSNDNNNIRKIKAELLQKKYGSTVNVNEFFTPSYINENIDLNNITNFCEDDCTIVKIIEPTKIETSPRPIKSESESEPEIIYFDEYSEKVGYKSFQYYCGLLDNKLILTDLNDKQIILIGQDISDEIKRIMEIL